MDHYVLESTSEPDHDCKVDLEAVGILFDELLSGNGQLEAKKGP